MYELRVAPSARRTLGRLPEKFAAPIIEFISGRLLRAPRRLGSPLSRELEGYLGARVGTYRVVYWIDEDAHAVFVERIDHRADIYRPR